MANFPFRIKEHVLPCQHIRAHARSTAHGQEETLHLSVKQYIPVDNPNPKPGDVTIIAAHANGFPKELYEPLWEEMLGRAKSAGFSIRAIWIADVAHQGASGVLNEYKLGNDPSWFDHPRDLLHMVNSFRDQMARPIVGVGHSMGGHNLVNLSLMHPRLFETLVLIDPVIQRKTSKQGNQAPAAASARRRDYWPSREVATEAFGRSKFYQTWDPRVLDLWVKHGLRDLPTAIYSSPPESATKAGPTAKGAGVTLTTTKAQEVYTFLRPRFDIWGDPQLDPQPAEAKAHPDCTADTSVPGSPFYRAESMITFHMLPFLRPSVLYIFGETSDLSAPELRADKMKATGTGIGGSGGAAEGRVSEVTMPGVGHLIPMEAVGKTAECCTDWLSKELELWGQKEEKERREWAALPDEKKRILSPRVLRLLGGGNGNGNGKGKTGNTPRTQKL